MTRKDKAKLDMPRQDKERKARERDDKTRKARAGTDNPSVPKFGISPPRFSDNSDDNHALVRHISPFLQKPSGIRGRQNF